MVTDIPAADDFRRTGVVYLNMAWTIAIDLCLHTEEEYSALAGGCEEDLVTDFWQAAQRPLANAASLLQQATEFLLKGRIAAVSPFLLVAANPRDWPRNVDKEDVPFADFRTIDAQDLVKVHDAVSEERLPRDFAERVGSQRRTRNAVMHTVDKRVTLHADDVLIAILDVSHHLVSPLKWVESRDKYLDETPESVAYSTDFNDGRLIQEFTYVAEALTNSDAKRYLGFFKRQRKYFCAVCESASRDMDLSPETAQLRPNDPTSTTVYCFVCREESAVARRPCCKTSCRGNVVSVEYDYCLICHTSQ